MTLLICGAKGDLLMKTLDRITVNPARLNGQPCIRDLRLTVKRVLEVLATYPSREELHHEYPELEEEDIHQALEYAAANLDEQIVDLPQAI
jgi:uncharacterized protein (DUF433 family)